MASGLAEPADDTVGGVHQNQCIQLPGGREPGGQIPGSSSRAGIAINNLIHGIVPSTHIEP